MATLFIAGATGYTGQALVRIAAPAHRVVAHIRPGSSSEAQAAAFLQAGAEVDRTPWQADAMEARLRELQPDVVFALLGTTAARGRAAARTGGPAETYESVDRDLTLLLARAAAGCTRPPRFVYLSSLGADRPGGNAYLRARYEVEAALMKGPLPWTIARPSFITGPDRAENRPGERFGAAAARLGLGLAAAVGATRLREEYGEMDAATLAAGLLRAALDPVAERATLSAADLRRQG